ncbi:MAG: hypothetical protein JNK53_08490, partial [Phycisphaerae bacterium]|nr:hypothetical protein [Phycisphaerae bacterium]
MAAWDKTGLHGLMQTDQLKALMGSEGASGNMEKHLKEIGAPAGSATWPDAFGIALYTAHNAELDTDEGHMLMYGDWGARADAFAQLVDASLADAVKKEKWKTESKDEIAGRKVVTVTIPESDDVKAMRQEFGGLGVDMTSSKDTFLYVRDGTRFFVGTERAGIEEALEVVDGSRKSKLPDSKDYQAAMDQLGAQDLSFALLTGPMQKLLAGEGMGMMAMMQPMIQPLLGDVHAWCGGLKIQGTRGQVELTATALVPGQKAGLWSLIGPSMPIEPPPPLIGPEAISYARFNVQFKEIMNVVNTVAANVPEMGDFLDPWLLNFGPAVTKALESMGPGMWMSSQVRQPVTPESLVSSTIIACANPKAVVPMLTQFGAPMGLEPRDVDGNTIFSSDSPPMSIGVSNGYMAMGDSKQVEQAMRAVGQRDLPSVSENAAFKRAATAAGSDPVVGWGYSDLVARWAFDREMLKLKHKEMGTMPRLVDESDDTPWAKRVGYKMPDDSMEKLATLEPSTVAKFIGPMVWTCQKDDKGAVLRMWVMPAASE